jgi:hypothetical protein
MYWAGVEAETNKTTFAEFIINHHAQHSLGNRDLCDDLKLNPCFYNLLLEMQQKLRMQISV